MNRKKLCDFTVNIKSNGFESDCTAVIEAWTYMPEVIKEWESMTDQQRHEMVVGELFAAGTTMIDCRTKPTSQPTLKLVIGN